MSEFLLEYTSGELDAAIREQFEQHIADCANCHEFLRQYRTTISAGQAAFKSPNGEASADLPEDLVKAILRSLESQP
jgi:anti-sigma factor RsiW